MYNKQVKFGRKIPTRLGKNARKPQEGLLLFESQSHQSTCIRSIHACCAYNHYNNYNFY